MQALGASGRIGGSGDGMLGGVQAGYDFPADALVFGIEADLVASGGRGDVTGRAGAIVLEGRVEVPWGARCAGGSV